MHWKKAISSNSLTRYQKAPRPYIGDHKLKKNTSFNKPFHINTPVRFIFTPGPTFNTICTRNSLRSSKTPWVHEQQQERWLKWELYLVFSYELHFKSLPYSALATEKLFGKAAVWFCRQHSQSKTNACEQPHGSFLAAPLVKQGIQARSLARGLRDAACWFVTWSASTCTAKTKPVLADVPQESSWANLSSFRLLATFLFIYFVQKLLLELYPETFPKASLIPHANS